ncbi:MAG: hypothetical protein HZC28_18880 [Spirochaetes bacterium]|nr:hypothetical protein [Spirochaetota bacterium]
MGDSTLDDQSVAVPGEPATVLKIRIRSISTSTYGIIAIIVNKRLRKFKQMTAAFSHYASFFDEINPGITWPTIAKKISAKRAKNELNAALSKDIENSIILSITEDAVDELLLNEENNDPSQSFPLVSDAVTKVIGDTNILFDGVFETVEADSVSVDEPSGAQDAGLSSTALSNNLLDSLSVPDGDSIFVSTTLVLAPVSGTPIYDIAIGNDVMVRVNNNTEREKAVNMRLNAVTDGKILAVPARIVDKRMGEKGECALLARISDNVYSKILETESVKVKRPHDAATMTPVAAAKDSKEDNVIKIIVWSLGGLLFLSAIATLLYFLILR